MERQINDQIAKEKVSIIGVLGVLDVPILSEQNPKKAGWKTYHTEIIILYPTISLSVIQSASMKGLFMN